MCPGELKTIGIHQTADSIFWSTGERDKDSITINGLSSPIKSAGVQQGLFSLQILYLFLPIVIYLSQRHFLPTMMDITTGLT